MESVPQTPFILPVDSVLEGNAALRALDRFARFRAYQIGGVVNPMGVIEVYDRDEDGDAAWITNDVLVERENMPL